MKELLKVLEFTADRTQALADSQSVAGEPLHVGDVTLIPVSSISCGFAGGGSDLPARTRNDAAAAGSGVAPYERQRSGWRFFAGFGPFQRRGFRNRFRDEYLRQCRYGADDDHVRCPVF